MSVADLTGAEQACVAGWYGKLPALGDFASRRLPASFVALWDEWLQRSLAASRMQLGDRWLPVYLKSPMWRFALMPCVCGPTAWAGILMPSVDRVGRYFPLTIALALDPGDDILGAVAGANDWFESVERLALATLNMSFGATDLERGLGSVPFPSAPGDATQLPERAAAGELARWWKETPAGPLLVELDSTDALAPMLRLAGPTLMGTLGEGRSLWWTRDGRGGTAALRGYIGLPPQGDFAQMMNVGQ